MAAVSFLSDNDNFAFSGGMLQDNGLFASLCFLDSDGIISVAVERCPLCGGTRKPFYCKDCVRSGNFSHSSPSSNKERYADRKQQWELLQNNRQQVLNAFEKKIASKLAIDTKRSQIRLLKQKIHLCRSAVQATKQESIEGRKMLNTLKVQNEEHEKRVAKQQEKRRFILKYTDQLQQKTAKHVEELNLRYADIQQLRRKHTSDLIACIFPVTEEKCESSSNSLDANFIENEVQYRVIAPVLPSCVDSAMYAHWLIQSPQHNMSSPCNQKDVAYNVSAALAYTAQLLAVMSSLLDCHVPYKLNYNEFYNANFTREQYDRLLAKMSRNILQLCFSQKVDVNQLTAVDMMHNLLELIYTPDLGRSGPFEVINIVNEDVDEYDVPSLEASEGEDNVDGEDGHGHEWEWEHVSSSIPDIENTVGSVSSSINTTAGGEAAAGGFMSSVTSLWRGSFWRKTSSPPE